MREIPAGFKLQSVPVPRPEQLPLGEWMLSSAHPRAVAVRQAVVASGETPSAEACLAVYGLLPEASDKMLDRKTLRYDYRHAVL